MLDSSVIGGQNIAHLDVTAGEGDADLVDLGTLEVTLLWLVCVFH